MYQISPLRRIHTFYRDGINADNNHETRSMAQLKSGLLLSQHLHGRFKIQRLLYDTLGRVVSALSTRLHTLSDIFFPSTFYCAILNS